MPQFTYKGKDKAGKKITETVEAPDRFAVYDVARKAGNTVDSIASATSFSFQKYFNVKKIESAISRVSGDDLVIFTRNLGSMLTAGLPLTRALSVIERQSKNPKLRSVITAINERIEKGEQLFEALQKHPDVFDDLYVSMVRAGEEGGTLAEALKILSLQMERASTLHKKIKGAMIYPAIVLIVMTIISILMMIFVMPKITATFRKLDIDLPLMTRVLIAISDFMVAYTVLVIVGLIAAVTGFVYTLRTHYGKVVFHFFILHIPVIGGIVKEVNAARTARTLASLLRSGVDVIRSLEITRDVLQNVYYKPILTEAAKHVEKGGALSEIFIKHEQLYPVFVGEMVAVGEETGKISDMLEQLAVYYEGEVDHKTKDLSTIVEPILMVVIGASVGFFALAMIAPIYSLTDSIG